jgi:bifunctional non-homologous end joining protein LigD
MAKQTEGAVRQIRVTGEGKPVAGALRGKPKGNARVEVDGKVVALTSLDKTYWPEPGYTKADYLRYLLAVSDTMLAYLKDRPLILKRFPNGVAGKFFFQHDVDQAPDFVKTYTTEALGHRVDYVVCNNKATLLWLGNQGAIPLHPWHSTTRDIRRPDYIVFDLDPGQVEFGAVRELALAVKEFLDELGLESYPKTSGSRGLHIYVPIARKYSYEQVAEFAALVGRGIAWAHPRMATTVRSLKGRKQDQIYVDHMQNAEGKTVVAAYSARERAAGSVSAPLTWAEVRRDIQPSDFTIKTMPARLKRKGDLFAPVLEKRQRLEGAMKKVRARG